MLFSDSICFSPIRFAFLHSDLLFRYGFAFSDTDTDLFLFLTFDLFFSGSISDFLLRFRIFCSAFRFLFRI